MWRVQEGTHEYRKGTGRVQEGTGGYRRVQGGQTLQLEASVSVCPHINSADAAVPAACALNRWQQDEAVCWN